MNKVTELFTSMTDDELSQAIREIKEDEPLGIIRIDGIVRKKCKEVEEITQQSGTIFLILVQTSILKEAAFRFTPQ